MSKIKVKNKGGNAFSALIPTLGSKSINQLIHDNRRNSHYTQLQPQEAALGLYDAQRKISAFVGIKKFVEENSSLLGSYGFLTSKYSRAFRRNVLPPSSR
jgi:hypothetical protein